LENYFQTKGRRLLCLGWWLFGLLVVFVAIGDIEKLQSELVGCTHCQAERDFER